MDTKVNKIVLAYSGGLDTSVILKWLLEEYDNCPVIAFTADLGQGEDLSLVEKRALEVGAQKAHVIDVREEFVKDYIFPMLRANAVYQGYYLLGTSIARPLIAKKQMEIAALEKADAVSHGATGKGNDQVRFELTYYSIDPSITVIAPWRIWKLNSRESLMQYAEAKGLWVPVTKEKPYSMDRNLFHMSFEGGILEDPWLEPSESMFILTRSPQEAPDKPRYIEIDYRDGDPVAVDGQEMSPANLLHHLNEIGGQNGVGRVDMVEDRFVGMKSRGVYETPGGTILHIAHRAAESITIDREVLNIRDSLIPRYAQLIYNGFWFSPERRMLQACIDESQKGVTGTARLKLYKGNCTVAGRKSALSLYSQQFATFEADKVYSQKDADGFIRLNALRLKIRALRDAEHHP